jgi:molecular chaperone DnaK (HSP70)
MGRSLDDLGEAAEALPYAVVEGEHATARVRLDREAGEPVDIAPQQISALFLAELKRWAEQRMGTPIKRAVVTVPAYFDDAQRQATRDAGRIAGLQILRIVNEPTAAALAYGLDRTKPSSKTKADSAAGQPAKTVSLNTKLNPKACNDSSTPQTLNSNPQTPTQTIAVYDLGGGTFDISILRLQQTEQGSIDQVLATDGDTHLGGDDFDQLIIALIQQEIREQLGQPELTFAPASRQAFRNLAEQTKIRLSTENEAVIEIDLEGLGGYEDTEAVYRRTLSRDEFETLIDGLIDRTLSASRSAVSKAGLSINDIDRVVLVGGSTRVPRVRQRVAELFEQEGYTALNPDEVVALGASVQAAIIAGIRSDALLLDVIPLSLGIETMGGAVAKLIVANSTIPARASERFSTYADGQTKVKIHVLQGERELVKDCRSLATFDLTGIPPMPAGLPKLEVTFLVDANGVLSVQAVEERSGRRARVQVVPNHGLTRGEVARMEADSLNHARQDMTTHRLIDLRLNANLDLRNIRRQLERLEDDPALDADYQSEVESHMAKVQQFIDTPDDQNDADAFQQALEAMDHATLRLAELNIARTLREENKS